MKRILLFIRKLGEGGAERVFVDYANGLINLGWDVSLVCTKDGSYKNHLDGRVKIYNLNCSLKQAGFRLYPIIRKVRPDVFLSGLTAINFIGALTARLSGIKHIYVSIHNDLSDIKARRHSALGRKELVLAKLGCSMADGVIAVSSGVRDYIVTYLNQPLEKIRVINNPIFKKEIVELSQQNLPKNVLNMVGNNDYIVAAGRLTYQKGFDLLIDAYANAFPRPGSPLLVIMGEGEERPALEKKIAELNLEGRVVLPGFVDNPYAVFSKALFFVLSSRWEGFGNVIVEALASGTHVIAFDCNSGPGEILSDFDKTLLVENGNVGKLSDAMVIAARDRYRYSPENYMLYSQSYSVDKCAEKISHMFIEGMKQKSHKNRE